MVKQKNAPANAGAFCFYDLICSKAKPPKLFDRHLDNIIYFIIHRSIIINKYTFLHLFKFYRLAIIQTDSALKSEWNRWNKNILTANWFQYMQVNGVFLFGYHTPVLWSNYFSPCPINRFAIFGKPFSYSFQCVSKFGLYDSIGHWPDIE